MIESKAWTWDKVDKQANQYWDIPAEEFLPIVTRWKGKGYKRALDLGCGTGRHAIFLAQNGFEVDALDLSTDGIEKFKKKIQGSNLPIKIHIGEMLDLPYADNTFDCLVAFHAVHHTDLGGLKKIIESARRILKLNGEAFVTLASKESDCWKIYASKRVDGNTLIKTEGPEIGVPHTYLDYEEVEVLLKDFSIIKIQQIIRYLREQNRKHAHFFVLIKK